MRPSGSSWNTLSNESEVGTTFVRACLHEFKSTLECWNAEAKDTRPDPDNLNTCPGKTRHPFFAPLSAKTHGADWVLLPLLAPRVPSTIAVPRAEFPRGNHQMRTFTVRLAGVVRVFIAEAFALWTKLLWGLSLTRRVNCGAVSVLASLRRGSTRGASQAVWAAGLAWVSCPDVGRDRQGGIQPLRCRVVAAFHLQWEFVVVLHTYK